MFPNKVSNLTSDDLERICGGIFDYLTCKLKLNAFEVFAILDMLKVLTMTDVIKMNLEIESKVDELSKKGINIGGIRAVRLNTVEDVEELITKLAEQFGEIPNYKKGKSNESIHK